MSKRILVLVLLCASSAAASAAVPADCWSQQKHGHRDAAVSCFESMTRSSSAYDRAEGFWGLEQWDQANAQFRLATGAENSKPIYKVRWGLLLHERFNDADAAGLFKEALAQDDSLPEAY